MNLLGPHIQIPGNGLDLLGRWKPAAVTLMDVSGAFIRQVRERSPETVICYRKYEHGLDFTKANPEEWADAIWSEVKECPPDYAYILNEPFGHDNRYLFEPYDLWQVRVGRRLRAHGIEPLINCFGTGNFTCDGPSIVEAFPYSCEEFDTHGPHDYSWPNLWDGVYYYALRWLTWYSDIKEYVGKDAHFLIGECGLTQAIIAGRPDHGWRSSGPEGVTDASYLDSLRWYNNMLCQFDKGRGIVLGATIFNFFDRYHHSFEHIGKDDVINTIIAMDSPVIPEKPNGGDKMIRVFDMDNVERDEAWAKDKYGVAWRHYKAAVGQKVYRLVELREKTGNSSLITKVIDENGKPIADLPITFYWSGAPRPPDPPTEVYAHDWYDRFTWGKTNQNGDVGPGMGTGAYHGWGEGGPHAVWPHDANIPSDICEKLGMLAGTFHDHLDQKFQLMTVEEEEPVNGKLDEILAIVKDIQTNASNTQITVKANNALLLEIKAILTTRPPDPPEETFTVEYFNNTTLSGTPVYTSTQKPPFWNDWGSGSPNAKVNVDNFSGRWVGKFTFTARTYAFNVRADDGIRLWVAGKLVIDQWHDQAPTTYSVKVPMTAGVHEVKIEWYERGGNATLHANWS